MNCLTSWDYQVGPVWVSFRKPKYWLYGRTPGYGRTWCYNWPGFVRLVKEDQ